MFAANQLFGIDFAFPNVCKTPAMVPVPFPDIGFAMAAIPVAVSILFNNAFAHNLATKIPLTVGDFPGVALGVISNTVSPVSRRIFLNSYTTLLFGCPANRMCAGGPQNRTNTIGFCLLTGCTHISIFAG